MSNEADNYGVPGMPTGLFTGQAPRNWWQDPAGYVLFHQSAPPGPTPMDTLAQQDWNYFQSSIAPIQQNLMKTAMDPNTYTNAANQAKQIVQQQFAAQPGVINREAANMGLTITPDQQAQMTKDNASAQALATASAANGARAATVNQMNQVMGL